MTVNLAFLVQIFFPLLAVNSGIKLKVQPYRVVIVGALYSVFCALVTLAVFSVFSGGLSEELDGVINDTLTILADSGYAEAAGIDNFESVLTEYYNTFVTLLPSYFFMWGAMVSYIEYLILSRVHAGRGEDVNRMTPVREFNLSRNGVIGWCGICIVASLLSLMTDSSVIDTVYSNTYALFRMVFAYQGMSFLAYLCHMKGWPKAVWIVVTILLLMTGYGTMFIYIIGLIDGILGLKVRIGNRS